jgi:AcrR family transcriptional regulator
MPSKKTPRPIRDAVQALIRRTPKQVRGQQRVDEILDATERLTRTTTWDKLSTNHIAREAGIPIGSLYQFFANKQAVAQALVERYLAVLDDVFANLTGFTDTATPAEMINAIFDRLLIATQKHQGLHAMLLTIPEDSEVGRISAPIRNLLRSKLEQMLASRAPWMSAEELKVHALLSHVSNRAIFAQAISLTEKGEHAIAAQLIQQARLMQIAYYDRLLQEHAEANP